MNKKILKCHWCEKGEMGWWGMSFNEMNEKKWKIQFDKFLSKIPDDEEVTVVDFHI